MKKSLATGVLTIIFSIFLFTAKTNAQCTASFAYSVGANGAVSFTNTSVGTSSAVICSWSFGDGNGMTTWGSQTVNYTYSYNQLFTVSLTINDSLNNQNCNATTTQTVNVTNASCTGTVAFTYYESANGNVYFNDASSGISPQSTYTFYFGDGTSQPSWPSSAHTYSTAGVYNVTITANGPGSICNYTAVQTVTVNYYPCNLVAGFTFTVGSNGDVNFTNTTTGASSNANYYWSFGDGGWSNAASPSYTYSSPGAYSAHVMVVDSQQVGCTDSITQVVNITGCFANVSLSMYKDSSQVPNIVWDAYVNYPPTAVSAVWSWGDGSSTSGLLFPSHTYSAAGLYNICVTVSVTCGATATACSNTNIYRATQSSGPITVNVMAAPNGIKSNVQEAANISVFPNPNSGEFELRASGLNEDISIMVVNIIGQEVYRENGIAGATGISKKINLNELSPGTYIITVKGNTSFARSKLIIAR